MSIRDFISESEEVYESFEDITKAMSGAEIAKELGITRQAVSNTLKRGMKKVFLEFKKIDKTWDDFDAAVAMSQGFSDLNDDPKGLVKFFKLFPPDIRKRIEADATKRQKTRV